MHTPGPWNHKRTHTASEDMWYVITDAKGYGPIVDVGGKDMNGQMAEAKYLVTDPEEIESNARLIAAAPELLEALELLLNYTSSDGAVDGVALCDIITKARAAIAKAKGE